LALLHENIARPFLKIGVHHRSAAGPSNPAAALSAFMNISILRWQSDIKPVGLVTVLDLTPI
jgi:hypothetical protein